jgi:hypothetical protein
MDWVEQGKMFEDGGNYGGDAQAGKAFDRRFEKRAAPWAKGGQVVTVAFYPVYGDGSDPMNDGLENGPFGVQRQAEFMVCGDVDNPGDTEESGLGDLRYKLVDSDLPTLELAEQRARELCLAFQPEWIQWVGGDATDGIVETMKGVYRVMAREFVGENGEQLGEVVKVEMGSRGYDSEHNHEFQITHLKVRTPDGVLWKGSAVELAPEVAVVLVRASGDPL